MKMRILTAAGVLVSAAVHLYLWFDVFRHTEVVGPAFMVNAVGGTIIAVLLVTWRHWIPLLLAVGFGASTLGAFVIATTVGPIRRPRALDRVGGVDGCGGGGRRDRGGRDAPATAEPAAFRPSTRATATGPLIHQRTRPLGGPRWYEPFSCHAESSGGSSRQQSCRAWWCAPHPARQPGPRRRAEKAARQAERTRKGSLKRDQLLIKKPTGIDIDLSRVEQAVKALGEGE